jgi:tetratricopeptide (TPR) repeat protein
MHHRTREIFAMNPQADPNFQEGCRRYWAGDFQKAIELLSRAAEHWPSFADAFNHIGLCHDALGDFSRAVENYQRAMQLAIKFRDPESEGMMRVHIAESLGQ